MCLKICFHPLSSLFLRLFACFTILMLSDIIVHLQSTYYYCFFSLPFLFFHVKSSATTPTNTGITMNDTKNIRYLGFGSPLMDMIADIDEELIKKYILN